jgi:hypothetical protein
MSNKQQTAVEWLIGEIELGLSHKGMKSAFHKAKELEKQQIMAAYSNNGWNDDDPMANAEQYYNETFNK